MYTIYNTLVQRKLLIIKTAKNHYVKVNQTKYMENCKMTS